MPVVWGSIEEGMLGILAFKKSLFAGVLDGGDSAVFMQGTRLSKFMESVDDVVGAMGVPEEAAAAPSGAASGSVHLAAHPAAGDVAPMPIAAESSGAVQAVEASAPDQTVAATEDAAPPAHAEDPWAPLLEAGLQWIDILARPAGGEDRARTRVHVTTNPATGERSLTLPLPEPATLERLAVGLTRLLGSLKQ